MKKNQKRFRLSPSVAEMLGCTVNSTNRYRLKADQIERLKEIRSQVGNTFENTLDDNNFTPPSNWQYGWLKTKEASVFVKNSKPIDHDAIRDAVSDAVRDAIVDVKWKKGNGNPNSGNLLVPNIFDLHLGKLAWGQESGEDYDIKIASQRFRDALEDLIEKSKGYDIERIMFPIGNDFFNSDKSKPFPMTTNGTPQTDDVRWQKMFRIGVQLITEAVIRLSSIAKVDVITVFGNHDEERVFYLGETIAAVFANQDGISINNNPTMRKYYRWGQCLLGLTHGKYEKAQDLPMIMAQESKEMWAETFYREWLLGHLHHRQKFLTQETKDYRGVRVTYLTSPSSSDSWHVERGYTGAIKGAEAYIYNMDEGLIGSVIHNIK